MNEKHTPGHWYATSGYVAVKTQNGHRVICGMSRTDSCMNYAAGVGSTEDASNAKLIAAAPDMLKALRECQSVLETAGRYFPKSIQNSDKFALVNILENSVKKIIAQAEGK